MNAAQFLGVTIALVSAICIALVLATVVARADRQRRERVLARLAGRHRLLLLEVASGEDEEGEAASTLAKLGAREWNSLRGAVITLLSKVRGIPAEQLVEVLDAHGEIVRARHQLGSLSAVRRARGAHLLGLARDRHSIQALVDRLSDPAAEVRLVAARSLGMIGDAATAEPILGTVARPGEIGLPAWVASEALLSLGRGAEQAVQRAVDHDDPRVREVAVTTAAHSMVPATAMVLRTRLAVEQERVVRVALIAALGNIGGPEDVETLVRFTHDDQLPEIRRSCVAALGELGVAKAAEPLAALLADPDRRLAHMAAQALLTLRTAGVEQLEAARLQGEQAATAAAVALELRRLRGLQTMGVNS